MRKDGGTSGARPPLRLIMAALVGWWVGLWALDSVKDWVAAALRHNPEPFLHALVAQVPWWGAWVLLAPVVAYLAWRFPPTQGHWKLRVPAHVVAGLVLGATHLLLAAGLFGWRDAGPEGPSVYYVFVDFFSTYMMFDFIAYVGMVGAVAAWTYYRGMRSREREAIRLATRTAELERAMSEARLESLRRQLHPHFLFNSLNTIAALARRGETERVTSTLERLGGLLRLRLDDDQPHEITLERELQWTENYLAIERERFGSKLEVHTSIPRNVRRALVPAMLLQPLVENAVRHGIATGDGCGRVGVEARRAGNELVVTVTDSGSGFGPSGAAGGIGLSNTRQRLEQLYGTGARLEVGNGTDGGAVTVRIPWHTENGGGTA